MSNIEKSEIIRKIKERYPIGLWIIFGAALVFALTCMVTNNALKNPNNMGPSIILGVATLSIFVMVFIYSRYKIFRMITNIRRNNYELVWGTCANKIKRKIATSDRDRKRNITYYYYIKTRNGIIKISDEWVFKEETIRLGDRIKVIRFEKINIIV